MKTQENYNKHLLKKVSSKPDYIGFYISEYQKYENLETEELKSFLECTDQELLRLALCRAPNIEAEDFKLRIARIANYANVPEMKLIKMLRRVSAFLKFNKSWNNVDDTYLLAAREKENDDDE